MLLVKISFKRQANIKCLFAIVNVQISSIYSTYMHTYKHKACMQPSHICLFILFNLVVYPSNKGPTSTTSFSSKFCLILIVLLESKFYRVPLRGVRGEKNPADMKIKKKEARRDGVELLQA